MYQFTAMLWKELLQVSNRLRFAIQKCALAGAVAGLFGIMAYGAIYASGRAATYEAMSAFGRTFFLAATGLVALALSLSAMAFASLIVVSENVRRRLPLLLVTPLGPGAIVGSKCLSVIAQIMLGFLVTLPVFAMLPVFGGVDWKMVVMAVVLIAANVWLYAAMGLAASVLGSSVVSAASGAAGTALVWNVLPLVVTLPFLDSKIPAALTTYVHPLSPLYVFAAFVEGKLSSGQLAYHAGVNAGLGAAFLAVALAAFRPRAMALLSGAPRQRRLGLHWFGRRGTGGAWSRPLVTRWFEPGILSKELACRRRRWALLPMLWFGLIWGMVFIYAVSTGHGPDLSDKEGHWGLFIVESVGFFFILSVYASTRVSGEKEAMTLQTLSLTRLGGAKILAGKAAAVIIGQALPLGVLLAHLALILWIDFPPLEYAALSVFGFAISAVFSTLLGIYFSLAAKKTSGAMALTAVTWFGGVWMALAPMSITANALGASDNAMAAFLAPVVPFVAITLALVLARSAKKGIGGAGAMATYAGLTASAFVLVSLPLKTISDEFVVALSILPTSGLVLSETQVQAGSGTAAWSVLPIQLAALAWMAATCLVSFEAKARAAG